jgi:hypothetical protein
MSNDQGSQPQDQDPVANQSIDVEQLHQILRRALALRKAGRYPEAAAQLDQAIALAPGESILWCDRGGIYF